MPSRELPRVLDAAVPWESWALGYCWIPNNLGNRQVGFDSARLARSVKSIKGVYGSSSSCTLRCFSCTCVQARRSQRMTTLSNLECLPSGITELSLFWEGLSLAWITAGMLGQSVSKPQESGCLCFPSTGIISLYRHAQLLHGVREGNWGSNSGPHAYMASSSWTKLTLYLGSLLRNFWGPLDAFWGGPCICALPYFKYIIPHLTPCGPLCALPMLFPLFGQFFFPVASLGREDVLPSSYYLVVHPLGS